MEHQMNRMDTFISGVAARTGMATSLARSATNGLLVNVMEHAPPQDTEAMLDLIPGTESALRAYFDVDTGELPVIGRGLGSFQKPRQAESSVFDFLDGFGVPRERSGTFVSAFLEFLDQRVGSKVARGVARQFVL